MASGDTLVTWTAAGATLPTSNMATWDRRNNHVVLDFDDSTDEACYFSGVMPRHYGGNGVTVTIAWSAATAASGTCRWECAFEAHADDAAAGDVDSDSFATAQTGDDTAASATGEISYATITHTDGGQMDNVAAGEFFRIEIGRDTTVVGDVVGDCELHTVEIQET